MTPVHDDKKPASPTRMVLCILALPLASGTLVHFPA